MSLLIKKCIFLITVSITLLTISCKPTVSNEGHAGDGFDTAGTDTGSSPDTDTSINQYNNIAPGGGGAFTGIAAHPTNPNIMFFGTNTGGIIRTLDGGLTFKNVTRGMMSRYIGEIKFAKVSGVVYLLVATPMGLYISDNKNGDDTIGDEWSLEIDGLKEGYAPTDFYHPILSIGVDPQKNDTVWIGIGYPRTDGENSYVVFETGDKRCDPYSVYQFSIRTRKFTPILSLRPELMEKTRDEIKEVCADLNEEAPSTVGPGIYSIEVHPKDSNVVLFAGDAGLYSTYDGGETIYEIGIYKPRKTTNLGKNFIKCPSEGCTVTPQTGEPVVYYPAICKKGNKTLACLPIENEMDEEHPLVRGTSIVYHNSKTRIFALIMDTGYANDADCLSGTGSYNDTHFKKFRGGPWYSDDFGLTWSYYNQAKDNSSSKIGSYQRCGTDERTGAEYSTWYNTILVDPSDPDHIYLRTNRGRGGTSGIWEHKKFSDDVYEWKNITSNSKPGSSSEAGLCYIGEGDLNKNFTYDSCYEDDRSDDLFRDGNSLGGATVGYMLVSDWNEGVLYAATRGLVKLTWKDGDSWSDGISRYFIDHLHSNLVESSSGIKEYWEGSELNNFCPSGGFAFLDDNGTNLVMGGSDSGLLLSHDSGKTWKLVRDNANYSDGWILPDDYVIDDVNAPVIYNKDENILYSPNTKATHDGVRYSILSSSDEGEIWKIIGGYCVNPADGSVLESCDDATTDNGLPSSDRIWELALDYTRSSKRILLVGTHNFGLYAYDPKKEFSQQWLHIDDGCPVGTDDKQVKVFGIWTDAESPGLVFVAFDSDDNQEDGIYQIKSVTSSPQCIKVIGDGETSGIPTHPSQVTLSKYDGSYYLVATGESHSYPVIYTTKIKFTNSTTIDMSSIDWNLTLDFNYQANSPTPQALSWEAYLSENPLWKLEYDHEYFKKKSFYVLETVPNEKNVVIASLVSTAMYDYHVSGHLYWSLDGGLTWEVASAFEELPIKSIVSVQFSPDNSKIYFSTTCSSALNVCSPFATNEDCD